MRTSPLTLLFTLALLLAACGGGGGSTGGGVVPSGSGSTPHSSATPRPTPTPTPTPIPGAGQPLAGPTTDPLGDWGPPGVAASADFPVQHSYDGSGQTIAVVIDSDVKRTDLSMFFSYFQIPTTARTIVTKPVAPLTAASVASGGSQDEATLDVETVAGLAPGSNILIYQLQDLSDQNITDGYNQILSDKKAYIVNSSFGGCEGGVAAQEDPVIATGAAAGVAFTASAGDDGNECDAGPPAVIGASWPASNPHVIGVGGTETDPNLGWTLVSHTVWNDNSCGTGKQCAGGGGISGVYSTPSYQTGLAGIASSTWRNTPDISYPGEDVGIVMNGKWVALNGTSWSSPEAAAFLAELYQYCGANGAAIAGVTEPASIPYYVYGKAPTDFLDVDAGKDQMASTTPFYTAVAGYDDASGLGVPHGWAFAQTACPGHVPSSGLMARSMMSAMTSRSEFQTHPAAYAVDVTPHVPGLVDEGVRQAQEPARIQIVLQPGPSVATSEASVVAALQAAGFTIARRFDNHLVVDAVAPSGTVNSYFRTSLHDVSQGQYGTRYLPSTQIEVPGAIAPYAARVSLDNVITRHHRARTRTCRTFAC